MKTKPNRGSALLLTTILLFVVLSLVVSLSYVTVMEQQMSSKTKSSVGSFFNADSGVEWALNKIANISGDTAISIAFGEDPSDGVNCPTGFGCTLYLLDENGKVIIDGSREISEVKAVRAVGTQTAGDPTQRAIEAAVGAGGGGCYTAYVPSIALSKMVGCKSSDASECPCLPGFINKGKIGAWGICTDTDYPGWRPPLHPIPSDIPFMSSDWWQCSSPSALGEAYVCCQN